MTTRSLRRWWHRISHNCTMAHAHSTHWVWPTRSELIALTTVALCFLGDWMAWTRLWNVASMYCTTQMRLVLPAASWVTCRLLSTMMSWLWLVYLVKATRIVTVATLWLAKWIAVVSFIVTWCWGSLMPQVATHFAEVRIDVALLLAFVLDNVSHRN